MLLTFNKKLISASLIFPLLWKMWLRNLVPWNNKWNQGELLKKSESSKPTEECFVLCTSTAVETIHLDLEV